MTSRMGFPILEEKKTSVLFICFGLFLLVCLILSCPRTLQITRHGDVLYAS